MTVKQLLRSQIVANAKQKFEGFDSSGDTLKQQYSTAPHVKDLRVKEEEKIEEVDEDESSDESPVQKKFMAPIDDFESEEYDDDKPNNEDFSEDEDFFDDLEKKDNQ